MDAQVSEISMVFVNQDERTCSLYHKHFREIEGTSVLKGSVNEGEDTLILPLPTAFGLYS